VHAIIEERKTDAIKVPQGKIVSVIAQTHVINVENETIALPPSPISVNLTIKEKWHVFKINATKEKEIEIEEAGIKVVTNEQVSFTSNGVFVGQENISLIITPAELRALPIEISNTKLIVENKKPYYEVEVTKAAKLLWVFDVKMPVRAQVNAQTGVIEKEEKPWWAFLVTSTYK
jgi:hypothetical protein